MAPIRRYLRISAYSVLEVRIYLDNPADAHRWLLHSSDPALPRIIQTVRPFVLPKLREENERKKKGGKKKSVKDVAHGEDFDVSIFLTDLNTPHAILTRAKIFGEKIPSGQAGSVAKPLEVGDDDAHQESDSDNVPGLRREDSEEDGKMNMEDIPMAGAESNTAEAPVEVSDSDEEAAFQTQGNPRRAKMQVDGGRNGGDDKKKMGFKTNYEGFRIYGSILCLVVKRKNTKRGQTADSTGQAMMENWITSTQENPAMLAD